MAVVLDEGEYQKGVEENMVSVLGRLTVPRGAEKIITLSLKEKLSTVWGFLNFKVISIGRSFFYVSLVSMSDKSRAMSGGTINLKPCFFRVSQWIRDFNLML